MESPCGIQIKIGQVWEDVDPRHPRQVSVVGFCEVTSYVWGTGNMRVPAVRIKSESGRTTTAQVSRFNGKRSGYRLVAEA